MSVLLWNCRGLGQDGTRNYIHKLRFQKKPGILFLSETLSEEGKFKRMKQSLKYDGFLEVPREGRGGGLALFWDKEWGVDLQSRSARHFDVVVRKEGEDPWRFTGVYGFSDATEKHLTWELMRNLHDAGLDMPWLIGGDFNCIMTEDEKFNGAPIPQSLMDGFCEAVQDCGLFDLGWNNSFFTWHRGSTLERLDRCLANQAWLDRFADAGVEVLMSPTSDHLPLLVRMESFGRNGGKRFRFEEMWLLDEECEKVVRDAWFSVSFDGSMQALMDRIAACSSALQTWARTNFGNVVQQMKACEKKFVELRKRPEDSNARKEEERLMKELNLALEKEYVMWRQRAKVDWFRYGDRNSKYFHARAKERKNHNFIRSLECEGRTVTDKTGMGKVVADFYSDLFNTSNPAGMDSVTDKLSTKVSMLDNQVLAQPFTAQEIRKALFGMTPSKAPGPDGMSPKFFQYFWPMLGNDVVQACQGVLNQKTGWPAAFNETIVVLIPKCSSPKGMGDLRPISLCNVVYKVISKALANRMQSILCKCISISQSAFVPNRLISDNILIASEILHFLRKKSKGSTGFLAAKLDLSKAYDRMEWLFIRQVMLKLGFLQDWIELVMGCMETVRYNFTLNGEQVCSLTPSRGLRQGDPISPYLFILGLEGLSAMLSSAEVDNEFHGIKVCREAPAVSHLFFADDSFIFCKATIAEATKLNSILEGFAKASGQCINLQKSAISFSRNTSQVTKSEVVGILGLTLVEKHGVYLGFPSEVSGSKKKVFGFVKDKLKKLTVGWHAATLSKGGKEVMLKAVASAIPSYTMSIARFPDYLCDALEVIMNRYWWGSTENKNNIHWATWKRMAIPKKWGGMGFRALKEFNSALLCKQAWRLLTQPSSLVARILKAKYYPRCDFLRATLKPSSAPSFTWKSILSAQGLLTAGVRRTIGNGRSARIWEDAWLPLESSVPSSSKPPACSLVHASDLMLVGRRAWNEQLVRLVFNPEEAEAVLSIPLGLYEREDGWAWKFTPTGRFTVSSAYQVASRHLIEKHTHLALDSDTWSLLWDLNVPAKIRVFLWRACREILPATNALRARNLNIVDGCKGCNAPSENAFHAICECPLIRDVWDTGPVKLPQGWESCASFAELFAMASKSLSGSGMSVFAYQCWLCWNNRNARVFEKELLSVAQIVQKAPFLEMEYRVAQEYKEPVKPPDPRPPPCRWKPPPVGYYKLNTDAACSKSLGRTGLGAVLRDSAGTVLWAMAHWLQGCKSPLVAEALAMREAVSVVAGMQLQNVVMETDSLEVVLALANESEPFLTEAQGIILDCLELGKAIPGRMVHHTRRGGNKVAHGLAKYSLSLDRGVSWFDDIPRHILDVARSDLVRV